MAPAVLIPSLNPDHHLTELVEALMQAGLSDIIVIDDGSKPSCRPIFDALSSGGCHVLTHAVNLGKGRALKTGINAYLNLYPQGIGLITADADGQHSPEDILRIAAGMAAAPDMLILGVRNFEEENVPFKSRAGNMITRRLFGFLSGLRLTDTQTGLRGIPRSAMGWMMQLHGERYEYEMNMLIECRRHALDIVEVPIETIYINKNAASHFHPLRDAVRIYALLARFASASVASSLLDIGLFALMTKAILPANFNESIAVSTVVARVGSSLFNYTVNKRAVFGGEQSRGTLWRYYALAIVLMVASLALVRTLTPLLGWDAVTVKIPVDVILFLASFKIQQNWVFSGQTGARVHRLEA